MQANLCMVDSKGNCSFQIRIKPRILKRFECLKYANWKAKGPIRLRTVKEVWRMCMDVRYPYRGYFNDAGHFIIEMNPRYGRATKRKRG
jgi:hypothetical protein